MAFRYCLSILHLYWWYLETVSYEIYTTLFTDIFLVLITASPRFWARVLLLTCSLVVVFHNTFYFSFWFLTFCLSSSGKKRMHRQPDHVMAFLLAELGTSGSLDGQQRLVVKGRFAPKNFEGILRRYVSKCLFYIFCI